MTNFKLADGTTINGKYRITKEIAHGGGGAVYRAIQVDFDREVALKFLHYELVPDAESLQRFEREARLLATLQNKHIPQVYSTEMYAAQIPFIAMEFVDGTTLEEEIRHRESWSWQRASNIAQQLCEALKLAHNNGIVHRDLKPGNIMIETQANHPDFVRIIDFGLARLLSHGDQKTLTATSFLLGTPTYMSPEMCSGEKVDHRADIYSLACIIYECLTGRPPFISDNPLSLIYKHKTEKPYPISEQIQKNSNPDTAELKSNFEFAQRIDAVILKALEKSPERRFQSMQEFEEALKEVGENDSIRFLNHGVDQELISSPTKRGRRNPILLICMVAIPCLAIFSALVLYQLKSGSSNSSKKQFVPSNRSSEAENLLRQTKVLIDQASLASKGNKTMLAKKLSRKALNAMCRELLLPRDYAALLNDELDTIQKFSALGKYLIVIESKGHLLGLDDDVTIENMFSAVDDKRNNLHTKAENEFLLAVTGRAINNAFASKNYCNSALNFARANEPAASKRMIREAELLNDEKHPPWMLRKTRIAIAAAQKNMEFFQRAMSVEKANLTSKEPDLPADWHELGCLYQNANEHSKAKECFINYLKNPGSGTTTLLDTMMRLAIVYELEKNYAAAIDLYRKALGIAKDSMYYGTCVDCNANIVRLEKLQEQR